MPMKNVIKFALTGMVTLGASFLAVWYGYPVTALTMLIMMTLSWSIARLEWVDMRKGGKR